MSRKTVEVKLSWYEIERNKLIPEAMRYADGIAGEEPDKTYQGASDQKWAAVWNKTFHGEMQRLARERFAIGIENPA